MFHKKEYIAIAGAIRQSHSVAPYSRLSALTDKLCEIFAADNLIFDEAKFREASKQAEVADPLVHKHKKVIDYIRKHPLVTEVDLP